MHLYVHVCITVLIWILIDQCTFVSLFYKCTLHPLPNITFYTKHPQNLCVCCQNFWSHLISDNSSPELYSGWKTCIARFLAGVSAVECTSFEALPVAVFWFVLDVDANAVDASPQRRRAFALPCTTSATNEQSGNTIAHGKLDGVECDIIPLSASTLLVGRQERHHRPVKSWVLVCWWWRFDRSFARLIAPVITTVSIILSCNKTG